MTYLPVIFFAVIGSIGLAIGRYSFRQYSNIVNTTTPISYLLIGKVSALTGISGCFTFFAIITISLSFFEKKTEWLFHEALGILAVTSIVGIIIFLGSVYQIFTTIKYRDFLIKKNVIRNKK